MTRTLARKGPEALQSSILKELSLAKGKAKSELGVGDPLPELVKECMLAAQYVYGDQVKNGVLPLSVMAQYVKQGTEIALMKAGVDAREAKAMGELYGSMLNPTGLKPETSLKIALDVAFPTVGPCFMSKAYETKVITTYERLRDAQIMVGMKDRSWQENLNLINSSVRQDKAEWAMNIIEPAWDKAKSFTDNVARLKEQLNLLQAIPEPDRDVKWRNRLQEMTQTWNIVKMGDPEAVALYQAALPEGMARAAYTVDPIGSEICEKIAVSTEELAVYFGVDPSTATTLGNTIAFVVPFGLGTKITQGTRIITTGFKSVSGKFKATPISWTAPVGTKQTYKVFQRTDIDWNMVRTEGPKAFRGKTNLDASRSGIPPQLSDGHSATLHHMGQDSRGPLVEASRKYHGVDKGKVHDSLHNQFGRSKPNPEFPIDKSKFNQDTAAYWKSRFQEITSKTGIEK
jgi:hypothetical protein